MKLNVNGREVIMPSTLAEITLGQRIAYHNEHGALLEQQLAEILAMEEGMDRSMAEMEYTVEQALRSFAFFIGEDLEAIRESDAITDILPIYHACLRGILEDEAAVELRGLYEWEGSEWELAPPTLDSNSGMTFGEFIDSKNIVQQMAALGQSRWESLQALCAIYLRRKGEPYEQHFSEEGSDRYNLMATLPMDIAIEVGFFLSGSLSSYLNTSASLPIPANPAASTASATLNSGAG